MIGIAITAIISAVVMITVVLLIRYFVGKQISKMAFMLIWAIITIRLLLPVSFESRLSIWNLVNNPVDYTQENLLGIYHAAHGINWVNLLLILWGGGALVFGFYFFINHTRFRKNIRDALPITCEYILEWQKHNSTFRSISIKKSDRITSPLTFGVLRPTIILPNIVELYEEEELKHILAHEYVHIRRFDYVSKIVLAITLSIHWFNPFVWLMYILANRDIELSCDEIVLRALDEKSSTNYALTLINAADNQNHLALQLQSGFAKHALEERVKAILDTKKKSNVGATFAISLIVIVLLVFAEPVAARINHRVRLREDGILVINGQEIHLDDHRNEHGTPIIDMREISSVED